MKTKTPTNRDAAHRVTINRSAGGVHVETIEPAKPPAKKQPAEPKPAESEEDHQC